MMHSVRFTEAQLDFIHATGNRFVEACPGAGKTQSIVERFLQRPDVPVRKGVALLSFTSAATNETRSRCAGRPDLLQCPNFAGTIDGFINRFIVGPLYRQAHGRWPSFKDSWEGVQGTTFSVKEAPGATFFLHWFSVDQFGAARIEEDRVPKRLQNSISSLRSYQRRAVSIEAARIHAEFESNGVIDSAGSRQWMWRFLEDTLTGAQLGTLLEHRFAEVIVDEVQDSDPDDVRLFRYLIESGINVVMVGDLEQAIFGFRGGSMPDLKAFIDEVHRGTRLNRNFRSAPAVCAIANSLRAGTETDEACGPWKDEPALVQLIAYRDRHLADCRPRVIATAQELGIDRADITVLAFSGDQARRLSGAPMRGRPSLNKLVNLAREAATVRDNSTSPRDRKRALERFRAGLRALSRPELLYVTDTEFYETIGENEMAVRDGCIRLIRSLDGLSMKPSEYKKGLKIGINNLGWTNWINTQGLRIPNNDVWDDEPPSEAQSLPWSTVHSFKGLQCCAIALVIPRGTEDRPSGLDAWSLDKPSEARRVLYVGATRAERLLVLVVDDREIDAVSGCLTRDGVPFEFA